MKKQVKAVLFAALLFSLLAVTALFASAATYTLSSDSTTYGKLAEAVTAAADGDTITVSGSETGSAAVTISKNLTINGLGSIGFSAKGIMVSAGEVTIENVTMTAATAADNYVLAIKGTGHLTVNSGNYTGVVHAQQGTSTASRAALYINGGTFTGGADYCLRFNNKYTYIEINGGNFSSSGSIHTVYHADTYCEVAIYGGTFTTSGSGHTYVGKNTAGTVLGAEGTDGPTMINNGSGSVLCNDTGSAGAWTIYSGSYTANTGRALYTVNRAVDIYGGSFSGTIQPGGVTVNIYNGSFTAGSSYHARGYSIIFTNSSGGNVFIHDGTFTLEKGKGDQILCQNDGGAHIYVGGGTFEVLGSDNPAHIIRKGNGTMEIAGGTFTHEGTGAFVTDNDNTVNGAISFNPTNSPLSITHSGAGNIVETVSKTATIATHGFHFYNIDAVSQTGSGYVFAIADPAIISGNSCTFSATGAIASFAGAGAEATFENCTFNAGAAAFTVRGDSVTLTDCTLNETSPSTGLNVPLDNAAEVDGVFYTDLADAIAAVPAGGTVKLLFHKGVLSLSINKTYTIDCANIPLTGIQVTAGTVTILNANVTASSGSAVVVTGGTCVLKSGWYAASGADAVTVSANAAFKMLGGELTAVTGYRAVYTSSTDCELGGNAIVHGTLQPDAGAVLTITGGSYDQPTFYHSNTGGYHLIFLNSSNNCKVVITGGTFYTNATNSKYGLLTLNDRGCLVEISGGHFTAEGLGHLIRKRNGGLTITGGTFISTSADSLLYVESDDTSNHYGVTITGGTFSASCTIIDGLNSAEGVKVKDALLIDTGSADVATFGSGVYLNDCVVLVKTGKTFKCGTTVTLGAGSPTVYYGGAPYYVWMQSAGNAEGYKPVIKEGIGIRLDRDLTDDIDDNGIRFIATVDSATIVNLQQRGSVSYGTLIAPADYVAVAGDFTHDALKIYANGKDGQVYADIPAKYGLYTNAATGDVTFSAALISIKAANLDRKFAAVPYILVNGVDYYYGDYTSFNTRSIKEAVGSAWADDSLICVAPERPDDMFPITLGAENKDYWYDSTYAATQIESLYQLADNFGYVASIVKHSWSNGILDLAPACTTDGSMTYTCEICSETKTVVLNKLGHSYNDADACTICGYIKGYFNTKFRMLVTSDLHLRAESAEDSRGSYAILEKLMATAYGYSASQAYDKLDGMFVVGDYTQNGSDAEMKDFFNYVHANLKDETTFRAILGNHEFWATGRYTEDSLAATFEKYLTYGGYDAVDQHIVVGGYHCMILNMDLYDNSPTAKYSDAKKEWLDAELAKAAAEDPTGTKPIFVFNHIPATGTVNNGGSDVSLKTLLSKYPQVIDFTGHSHHTLMDPRSIWQGGYTTINTGSLAYLGLDLTGSGQGMVIATDQTGSWATGDIEKSVRNGYQYYLVEVDDADRIRLVIYNYMTDQIDRIIELGNVGDPSTYTFNNERKNESTKPSFERNATLTPVTISATSALFKIPQATSNDAISNYRVDLYDSNDKKISTTYRLSGQHFGSAMPDYVLAPISGLAPNTSYTIRVTAVNYWSITSDPLVYTFTTSDASYTSLDPLFSAEYAPDGGAINGADGTALRQNGNATTAYDSTRGEYVAVLDGNSSYCFDNMSSYYDLMSDSFTFEVYMYLDTLPSGSANYVDAVSNQQNGGFGFEIDRLGNLDFLVNTGGSYTKVSATVSRGQWIHVVGVYDGTSLKLYKNGALVGETACSGAFTLPDTEARYLCIGGDSAVVDSRGSAYMTGKIGDVNLYADALTADQIAALYNSTN